ncbi:NUDIX hydrolase [Patescibacteria group bacterium]|nr:NUDIX hydrolase [Patescibacteria group bacterium]
MSNTIYGSLAVIYYDDEDGRQFLVVKNKKTGNYTLVGGACEEGEDFVKSLQREITEELGLSNGVANIVELPIVHKFVFNQKKTERTDQKGEYHLFSIEFEQKHEEFNHNEIDRVLWLPFSIVVETLTFPDQVEVFREAREFME